ncbi:phage tail tape measure protein [Neobacillus drentensis]|uniref:phage tail tape measure protein n=1 Tax=Neobacillus drentensis TaxID=220684 RepID=UPI002FFF4189
MAEEIGSLHIDMSLTNAEFKKGIQESNNLLKVAASEFKLAGAGIKDFGKSMDGLKAKSKYLEDTLKAQQQKVDYLRQRYDQLKSTQGENAAATQRMLVAYNNAQAAMRTTQARLEEVTEQIELQSNRWHQLGEQLNTSGEKLTAVGGKMKDVGSTLTTGVTAPILAFGAGALKVASDFDSSSDRIQARLGVTAERARELGDVAEDVWKDAFGENMQAVGDAITIVNNNLNGLSDDGLKKATEAAYFLSDAFDADIGDSTKAASALMKNFGIDSTKAFDIITTGFQKGGDYSGELLDTLNEYSTQFASMGLSADQFLSILIKGSQEGAFSLDKVGDAVKEFNVRAQDGSKTTAAGFKAIKLDADKMGKSIAQGGEDGQKAFVATVSALAAMKDPMEQNTAGVALFGTQWEDVRKNVISSMSDAVKNIEKVDGASKKASDALYDNFGSRLQSVWRDFQEDLQPVGEDLLEIADDVLPKAADAISKVTGAFADLSPEGRKTALAVAGIAAAAGPVLVITGTLVSSVGTIVTAFGAASTAIAGSAGLTAAMTALTGPVGLVTGGIVLGTAAVVGLTKAYKDNKEISFESLEARQKEIEKNDQLIKNFDDLQRKNQLSNDEMLRFLDINSEISSTSSPEKIAELKKEQEKLLEKSGLTNKEMDNFLKYNDDIIKKAPNTEKAISSQGNAFAVNTTEIRKANAEKLKGLKIDEEMAMSQNLEKENGLLANKKKLQEEINSKEMTRKDTYEKINTITGEIQAKETEVTRLKKEQQANLASGDLDAINRGKTKLEQSEQELLKLKDQKSAEQSKLETILKQINSRQNSLDIVNKDLKTLDASKYKYEALVLAQVGLNSEKGKGLEKLETEISKLQKAKQELSNLHAKGKLNTAEYNDQVSAIDEQIGKLQGAETELKNVNEIAGKTVYKDVIIDEKAKDDAEELNRLLRKEIYKNVYVTYPKGYGRNVQQNAKGTRYAPEGLSWVGEEGPELMYLPRGTRIIPNPDSEQLLRNWNIPMLANGGQAIASGIALVGERGRELVDMRGARTTSLTKSAQDAGNLHPLVQAIEKLASREVSFIINGREFVRATIDDISDALEIIDINKNRMGGVT